jgi:small-conductance mechanosensitive channel
VDLLTTTFRQTTGEVFIMSNADLARGRIYNMRRSTNAVVVLSFVLSFDTSWPAIDSLKSFIMQYLEKHSSSWKPGADLYVDSLQRTESIVLDV